MRAATSRCVSPASSRAAISFSIICHTKPDAAQSCLYGICGSQVFSISSPFKCGKRLTNPLIGDRLDCIEFLQEIECDKRFCGMP